MPERALAGLVVLDLSQNVSGPYCTKLLVDYGAEVIKIEPPHGDPSRLAGPFPDDEPHHEKSGLFLGLNTGKKSVTLDLKREDGPSLLKRLAERADILVENFRPGALTGLGLGYEALADIKPSLIMASISYFGQWGPYCDWDGEDIVAQAMGGIMHLTGKPDRQPLKLPLSQAEFQAGLNAAVAILCALYFRDESGEGQHIDISIHEAVASILEGALTSYGYSGHVMERVGPRHQQKCPSTMMRAKDRFVHIQAGANWDHFATLPHAPQLMEPRLASILRYRYADEVEDAIRPWVEERESGEIMAAAQEWRVPVGVALDIAELETDPQSLARGSFQAIDHPQAGRLTYPGAPFKMDRTPAALRRAPLLGEHNREVYSGLGLDADDLARMEADGVI